MTSSSYASTARPPQLNSAIDTTDFGDDDFGNIFDGLKKNGIPPVPTRIAPVPSLSQATAKNPPPEVFHQARVSPDMELPPRTASRPSDMPSPLLERPQHHERRYSWDSRKSSEQLISGESSALASPNSELFPTAPKAAAVAGLPNFASMRGYSAVPNRHQSPEIRDPRDSPTSNSGFLSAQSNRGSNPSQENLRGLSSSASHERLAWSDERPRADAKSPSSRFGLRQVAADNESQDRACPSVSDTVVPSQDGSTWDQTSADNTPRPRKSLIDAAQTAFLFDGSPTSPASRMTKLGQQRGTPSGTPSATPKKMTKAQFEQAAKIRNSRKDDDDKSETSDTEDMDDEDEVDKQKKIVAQRRRQEATMSVYRQQMKKVTGGGGQLSDLPSQTTTRSPLERSSTSNLAVNFANLAAPGPYSSGSISPGEPTGEEEDEDVPLGILQAHGFPTKVRQPNHLPGSQPSYASSAMADASGAPLPAFARKLPADPYFGAGLVNPAHRESLGFANSTASMYGGPASPQMPAAPPGGLIGVIASEERSRAGRRGSPSPLTGGYGPMPLPNNLQANPMAQFGRSQSMLSLNIPQTGMGGGFYPQNGYQSAISPAEQASLNAQQQMAQFMQMQTQMMQQMMALQAGQMQGGQSPGGQMQMGQMGQMGYPFPTPQPSTSMNALGGQYGFLQTPHVTSQRPLSTASSGRPNSLAQGRSMTMLQPPANWSGDLNQQRSNTMTGTARSQYAGSVYGMNANGAGPGPGYTPSIAPSERSNVGMPSRYRPVSTMEPTNANNLDQRSKTMTSLAFNPQSYGPTTTARSTSPLAQTNGNATKPKSTIRIIEKLKGTSKFMPSRRDPTDDDEDDAGWAQMAKKKEALRQKRANKNSNNDGAALADLYQGLED